MATPSVMVFPPSAFCSGGVKTRRTLIIRNPTNKDFVVKLVPSCKQTLVLEGEALLLQARKYAPVSVVLDQKVNNRAELSIYIRPVEAHNHQQLIDFCKNNRTNHRQLAAKLTIRVENGFSANETILDLPGRAPMFEAVTMATAGIDIGDTQTCQPIDGDCATAPQIGSEEFARIANQRLGEEKCWLLGPLIDALFPPAVASDPIVDSKSKKSSNVKPIVVDSKKPNTLDQVPEEKSAYPCAA